LRLHRPSLISILERNKISSFLLPQEIIDNATNYDLSPLDYLFVTISIEEYFAPSAASVLLAAALDWCWALRKEKVDLLTM